MTSPYAEDSGQGRPRSVRIIFPIGMLGGGITEETVARGISLGAEAIAVDGGSTDSGPHYLGAGIAKTSRGSLKSDLRTILVAGRRAGIPVVVTTCGTSGTDSGVDWVAAIAQEIADEEGLRFRLARIYSELTKEAVLEATLRAMGVLGGDRASDEPVVLIGDDDYDVAGAAAHGLECIGVAWGSGGEDELRDAGAAAVVGAPDDLLALLRRR